MNDRIMNMLDLNVRERLIELIHPHFEELRDRLNDYTGKKREELVSTGNLRSGAALRYHHDAVIKQVEDRVGVVLESIKRVVLANAIPYSDNLAAELKQELHWFVPLSLWELPQSYPDVGDAKFREKLIMDLRERRERILKKAIAEVNLFTDGLRTSHVRGNRGSEGLYQDIVLLDQQKELLLQFVNAHQAIPKEKNEKFLVVTTMGSCIVHHPGLSPFQVDISDIESLGEVGLLRLGNASRGSEIFSITPQGFKYAEWYREIAGNPIERVTNEVRNYVDYEQFKGRYSHHGV